MNHTAKPRSPKWPFFVGDAALLAAAFFAGNAHEGPLSTAELLLVSALVVVGAGLLAVPFLTDFITSQREAELELLAKLEEQNGRLHQTADVIASATGQLKSAHEAATRAVHTAETLPYRLQEKIGEFTTQLQESEDAEKAAMAKELEALRDTEGERLSALADKIEGAAGGGKGGPARARGRGAAGPRAGEGPDGRRGAGAAGRGGRRRRRGPSGRAPDRTAPGRTGAGRPIGS